MNLDFRFLNRLSDQRQLWEFTLTTACVDTNLQENGKRGNVNAFKSYFAPAGTGYARFEFSFIADIDNMNVQMNLNLLVTPNFFQLVNEIMQHGPVYANHALHIGVRDALQNKPGFTGFYLLDDYVCSKQSLDSGPAALRPVRVAFIVRGCGLQHVGGPLNLLAFYVVGIPLSTLFTFKFKWGLNGIWAGMGGAFLTQALSLGTLVTCADFNAIAERVVAAAE